MKKTLIPILLLVTLSVFSQQKKMLTDYVNPFIGTGPVDNSLSGNNYPGATVPFGMVQLSPDTRTEIDWDYNSGYNYNDKHIVGFSHTHLSGTGLADFFDILFLPVSGDIDFWHNNPENYQSAFSHDRENARPGYYQVLLDRYNVNSELTATTRCGFHKYTYPKGESSHLIVNLVHSRKKGSWDTQIIKSQIRQVDEYTVEGFRIITGWARLRKVYFQIKFSKPIIGNQMTDHGTVYKDISVLNSTSMKAVFDFDTSDGQPLLAKVAISPVSVNNAHQNMQTELSGWNFDEAVQQAEELWNKELGKIEIEANDVEKEIFYTSLYHSFIQPNAISDVNGDYMASDFTVKNINNTYGGAEHYSTFSLWDTYRGAHPLYTILQPERTKDFVRSLVRQYDTDGHLPVWQIWGQDNYCMIGNHSIPVIVDAIGKGIAGLDVEKAYEAVKNSSMIEHVNSPFKVWEKYKYMPENIQSQSVSITLEMAYNDWCVAQLAKQLGKEEDYAHFIGRSRYYRNLYNSETNFFQPRDDRGNWIEPFNPLKYGGNGGAPFTEGNAWQYYWYVPHDVEDLINLTGGKKAFLNKLDTFFSLEEHDEHINNNASGFIGQYAHGNEPSHHVAYLYNYAGQPAKTQYYVNKILTELYNNSSSGYAGNDDCGEMSVWYVFGALGFYPVNPANGIYDITSPLFTKASLDLGNGKYFTITTNKKSDKDIYIQSATLNGKKYEETFISHQQIMNGGTIEFKMGNKPSRWGTK